MDDQISLEAIRGKLDDLARVFEQDGVVLACLFGSVADGYPGNDVDIAVLYDQHDYAQDVDLAEAAARVLGTKRVDIVPLNFAYPPMRVRALDGIPLYARTPDSLSDARFAALVEYEDYQWFMKEFRVHLDRHIQEGLSVAERRMEQARVEKILAALNEAVANLRDLRGRFPSYDGFVDESERHMREACVHYLRIAIECVLDVCRHFLSVTGVRLTQVETANLIALAGGRGLLDPDFAREIKDMAGMRNVIVHMYADLDYRVIYRAIAEELEDFDEFARQVRIALDRQDQSV